MASDISGAQGTSSSMNGNASGDSEYIESSTQGAGSYDSSHNSFASARRPKAARLSESARNKTSTVNGKDTVPGTTTQNGHQEEDLWGSILNSVKSSRAIPVKNVIILGERLCVLLI
jgi:hypothetical protein